MPTRFRAFAKWAPKTLFAPFRASWQIAWARTLTISRSPRSMRGWAVMGIVTYADDDTLNLFTEFGVSQEAEINFDLANKKDGDLRKVMCRCDPQNAEAPRRCGLHARSCLRGR